MLRGRWSLISKNAAIARSSHSVSVTNTGLLIVYGGELKPRTPVDTGSAKGDAPKGSLHAFDLSKRSAAESWHVLSPAGSSSDGQPLAQSVPESRVGPSAVWHEDALYMWGGRGGQEMTPLDGTQTGIWKATLRSAPDAVHWERLVAVNEDKAPAPRSYHTSVVHGDKLYVHAGCPATGRLGTLHAFDVKKNTWEVLASAPEPGRGGTCLLATSVSASQDVLLRYGGFSGYELPDTPGTLDIYSISERKWYTVQPAPDPVHGSPGPRSVHGFTPFRSRSTSLADAVALLYHGEKDASSLGHAGAGTFWEDVWVLTKGPEGGVLSGWAWRKVEIGAGDAPEGRGWFPPASWVDTEGNTRVVLFGGLLSSNTRSDELWELHLD
ncbi:galactose oxidase [Trametes elegans]|nr:galactose oxidase [Trametes elegans]